jgi:hypothetical protein
MSLVTTSITKADVFVRQRNREGWGGRIIGRKPVNVRIGDGRLTEQYVIS